MPRPNSPTGVNLEWAQKLALRLVKCMLAALSGPRSLHRLNIWSKETELPAPKEQDCECFAVIEFHREPIGTCNVGYPMELHDRRGREHAWLSAKPLPSRVGNGWSFACGCDLNVI